MAKVNISKRYLIIWKITLYQQNNDINDDLRESFKYINLLFFDKIFNLFYSIFNIYKYFFI